MRRLFIISLIFFSYQFVYSQINNNGIPITKNYSPQEYNAAEQNWAVVQDQRGVMYFGNNDDGVLEYDGNNWRKIPIPNNSRIYSLAIDRLLQCCIFGNHAIETLFSGSSGSLKENIGVLSAGPIE